MQKLSSVLVGTICLCLAVGASSNLSNFERWSFHSSSTVSDAELVKLTNRYVPEGQSSAWILEWWLYPGFRMFWDSNLNRDVQAQVPVDFSVFFNDEDLFKLLSSPDLCTDRTTFVGSLTDLKTLPFSLNFISNLSAGVIAPMR